MDTAKAVNLYTTYPPADFFDYVNPPLGKGMPVPGPLKPLIAIPTTAGTGSETTGVSIFDVTHLHTKTGIASRRLKPTLGLLDPDNTRTMPPQVAASTGLDILSHAVESYTALPFTERPMPERPSSARVSGVNLISDIGHAALRMVAEFLVRASTIRQTMRRAGALRAVTSGVDRECGRAPAHGSVKSQQRQELRAPPTSPIIRSCRTAFR